MFVNEVSKDLTQKAGQKCTAIRRIFVPEPLVDAAIEALVERLQQAVLGDPDERATTVSPLATAAQQRDVRRGIAALSEVATLVHGDPDAIPSNGYFVGPCLFGANGGVNAAFVHDHEVFGPVATVCRRRITRRRRRSRRARARLPRHRVYSDDVAWAGPVILGIAAHNGRVQWGIEEDRRPGRRAGTVLPNLVHGGPGRAGGGEELGGERGCGLYSQRTAIQGDRRCWSGGARGRGDDASN